jgi:hypothetical protein
MKYTKGQKTYPDVCGDISRVLDVCRAPGVKGDSVKLADTTIQISAESNDLGDKFAWVRIQDGEGIRYCDSLRFGNDKDFRLFIQIMMDGAANSKTPVNVVLRDKEVSNGV